MRRYPVRKFLGLFALYAVLIVGILVLQFKTESVFNKNSGSLRITMAQTQGSGDRMVLKNQFQASFSGLLFSADSDTPVFSYNSQNPDSKTDLILDSFQENYEGSDAIRLNFTNGAYIVFQTAKITVDDAESETLSITATPAAGDDTISLPYKILSTHNIEDFASSRIILNSGNGLFALSAPYIKEDRLDFVSGNNIATYAEYNPTSKFEFIAVTGMPLTDSNLCNTNIKHFRDVLVTRFTHPASDESDYTEDEVVSYVAEMASRGNFDDGINFIPESFQRSSRRTYVSAPFFGRLAALDQSLDMAVERLSSMVQNAINQKNLDIFTVSSINDYILREKKKDSVERLLTLPYQIYSSSPETFNPSAAQITGIISVYTKLLQTDSECAILLSQVMEPCLEILASKCTIADGRLIITDGENEINTVQIIKTGNALKKLGEKIQRIDYTDAGCVLLNQGLESVNAFNLQTLADLYPVLVEENGYYPHCQILGYYGTEPVWAWTCSPSVSYNIGNEGIVSMTMEFPLKSSEYIYFKGVPNFYAKIEMQQLMYRSDPTFESYNSSGYVYNADTKSLYIKSRHNSQVELIRIWCDPVTNFSKS